MPYCPGCGAALEDKSHTYVPAHDHPAGVPNAWTIPVGWVSTAYCAAHGAFGVVYRTEGTILAVVPFRGSQ